MATSLLELGLFTACLLTTSTASSAAASRVSAFQANLQGQLILAPLTRGGNLPFRRLCTDGLSMFTEYVRPGDGSTIVVPDQPQRGANMTMSEMAYARFLFQGDKRAIRKERALLKRHSSEKLFGLQIATKSSDEAIKAVHLAQEQGIDWVDLNCGCPIYEATRRGLGAELLKKPDSLINLVKMTVDALGDYPFTVKIRLGPSDSNLNVDRVVEGLVGAGASAITIHGRTMTQRYSRPADWDLIRKAVPSVLRDSSSSSSSCPIIGNGDILTYYEAEDRMNAGGVSALMVGRGALIKPWIFDEFTSKISIEPRAEERVTMLHRLTSYFKEHFGSDDFGKRHSYYFLPWHFEFLCRYRPLPVSIFGDISRSVPLVQNSRMIDDVLAASGLGVGSLEPLEMLLRSEDTAVHLAICDMLWEAESAEDAISRLRRWAEGGARLEATTNKLAPPGGATGQTEESWEVGGSGLRVEDSPTSAPAGTSESSSSKPRPARGELSSRWTPKLPKDYLALLEIRSGLIVESFPHPAASTLIVNRVDVGKKDLLTVITGRRDTMSDGGILTNLTVALVCNMKPRHFALESILEGAKVDECISEGLILFAHSGESNWTPILAPSDEPPGSLLHYPGSDFSEKGLRNVSPTRATRAWKAVATKILAVRDYKPVADILPGPSGLCSYVTGKACTTSINEGCIV